MRILVLILLLSVIPSAFADQIKVELNPAKPIAGEMFQAIFRIFTESDEEPVINFSPSKVEVVGKNNYGVKTSMVYANGKLTQSREVTIIYDLAAGQPGFAGLRNITVQLGSKVLRHGSINFDILKEAVAAAEVFIMADVPKKSLYLGEGMVIRYYLYSKVTVNNFDVKKYPKLNNFLKRFLQEPDRTERVSVDGEPYLRVQIYGVKVFPEKVGELKIDPMQMSATIIRSRGGDPFGNFGAGRESQVKMMSSETVKVEVKPLPEPKDPNFTGLVGKHNFELQLNSSKLIVNEPLELKLTVSGGGALENMEAPLLLKHADLEDFESNGDLKIQDAELATKVFDYTFLPKSNLKIPASTVTLSYLDPDSGRFVPVNLPLSEIIVAGGSQETRKERKKNTPEVEKDKPLSMPKMPTTLAGPIFESIKSWKSFLNYFNFILAGVAVLIAVGVIVKKELPSFSNNGIPSQFKKGQFQLSEFTKWLTPVIAQTGKSPLQIIKDSDMGPEAKTYFIDLLNSNDYKDYSHIKGQFKFVYKSDSFKELDKYIQSVKNENTSRPA